MDVVGLIPARAGSKGIVGKNVVPLAGKPLIAWTIAAARASRSLTRVVVSTDSEKIGALAREYGAEMPFLRPSALAADDTPMVDVVLHALGELERCDVLVLLQPTSPLREPRHIDEAVDLLLETGADTVVSVVRVPHRYEPDALMALKGDRLAPLGPPPTRRQDKTPVYARNGPVVLAVRPGPLRSSRDFYSGDTRAYVMDACDSLDVDELFDLELADLLLASKGR